VRERVAALQKKKSLKSSSLLRAMPAMSQHRVLTRRAKS
jgi:hypothetical protein